MATAMAILLIAQAAETGLLELVKAVGLAGALLALILIWLTRSFIPRMQDDNEKARTSFLDANEKGRKEFLEALARTEARHERSIDKLIASFERDRNENLNQHREFDSRIDELERDEDRGRKE